MRVTDSDTQSFQQFRGGAPDLKERGLPTGRKLEASRLGRKPTQWGTNTGIVADGLAIRYAFLGYHASDQ
jgi:hypothetical protein